MFFEKVIFDIFLNNCHGDISLDMNLNIILKHAKIANVKSNASDAALAKYYRGGGGGEGRSIRLGLTGFLLETI